ncbi:MAG: DUF1801 domain-containing protein [Woeseiaceae bacterium]|nr:DUF1801 domain-containing protein [Woeseiaceae bacterium]
MAEPKTKKHAGSVKAFLDAVEDPRQRADARKLSAMMRSATGKRAALWGPSIVGFGSYHYRYESGREGDWPLVGFSPRKGSLSVYIMPGFERYAALLKKLGQFKTGKSCLYIKRLEDVDEAVLEELIRESVAYMRDKYPTS